MKICILSMQRVENFGSLLQAYSLKQCIEQLGHQVSFLNIEQNEVDNILLNGKIVQFSDQYVKENPLQYIYHRTDRYSLNRVRNKWKLKLQKNKFESFRREYLQIDAATKKDHFECCVIGSDEVFNCMQDAPWGFTSQLFGNVKQAKNVITYAASCGGTRYSDLPEQVARKIQESFCNISAFSVRDANTKDFVSALTDKEITEHLDPVLIANFDTYIENAQLPKNLPERYCVVYAYHNRIKEKEDIAAIKEFCKEQNLKLVAVGAPQMWIKDYLVLSPFQALKVIKNASFVITDTFHGTIFSAKYARYFAIKTRPSNENKLYDLVKKLGLEAHLINNMGDLVQMHIVEHSVERMEQLTNTERIRSLQYLSENLKEISN